MKKLLIFALTILLFVNVASAQNYYEFEGYVSDQYNIGELSGLSVNYSGTCQVRMEAFNSLIKTDGSSYTSSITYQSPDGNSLTTSSTQTYDFNTSCKTHGSISYKDVSRSTDFYESKLIYSTTADSGRYNIRTQYRCSTTDSRISIGMNNMDDSRGWCSYKIRDGTGKQTVTWVNYLANNYNFCGNLDNWDENKCRQSYGSGGANDYTVQYIYPFNSSTIGDVIYNFTTAVSSAGSTIFHGYSIDLINLDAGTNTTLYSERSGLLASRTQPAQNGILSLDQHSNYLFAITFQAEDNGIAYTYTTTPPNLTLSIFTYTPDYVCGAYSDCVNSTRYRVCEDSGGVAPDSIETISCIAVIENATLGFEESVDTLVTTCEGHYDLINRDYGLFSAYACRHEPANITVERPVNWTVINDNANFNRYFIDFTSEWRTEGSRSLKMWTIPPKDHEPFWDGAKVDCGNQTFGVSPYIRTNMSNDTLRLNYDVTFPSSNMRLRFDAKRCNSQVVQHEELVTWNVSLFGIASKLTACPKLCFASECTTQPTSVFWWDIIDNETGDSILGGADHKTITETRRQPYQFDLSGLGIVAGKTYKLTIAVESENPYDTRGNCVMFDNIRYDVLAEPFLNILGGACESRCVEDDYYEASTTASGGCFVRLIEYGCADAEILSAMNRTEDVCKDSTTLLRYSSVLGDYVEIPCENGCSAGSCITEPEEEDVTQEELAGTDLVSELIAMMSTRLFWALLFTGIITIFSSIINWRLGIVCGIISVVFFTAVTWLPVWIAIAIIVIEGLILANEFKKAIGD